MADAPVVMKRFYTQATVGERQGGFEILLDGRPVRTPARTALTLPTRLLAEAIAQEWNAQGDTINPRSMALTGLSNAAIDRVAPDRQGFAAGLAAYGNSDLVFYRAEHPADLVRHQAELWDPLVEWARRRFDSEFVIVSGIIHQAQPEGSLSRLSNALESRTAFELAALSPLVTIGGSLLIALALAEHEIGPAEAWEAASADETYQMRKWGEDSEARTRLDLRKAEFESAYKFLSLLDETRSGAAV